METSATSSKISIGSKKPVPARGASLRLLSLAGFFLSQLPAKIEK
jgi:hypothetical protein